MTKKIIFTFVILLIIVSISSTIYYQKNNIKDGCQVFCANSSSRFCGKERGISLCVADIQYNHCDSIEICGQNSQGRCGFQPTINSKVCKSVTSLFRL